MPKMGGRELAERLRALHPEAKVLHMSGYADAHGPDGGPLAEASDFIAKPFTPEALARKVRDALDAP